jgi:hypothetical protein
MLKTPLSAFERNSFSNVFGVLVDLINLRMPISQCAVEAKGEMRWGTQKDIGG